MLKISRDSWHFAIYRWWFKQKKGYDFCERTRAEVNLCPYMRVVLFWGWLRYVSTARYVSGFWWGLVACTGLGLFEGTCGFDALLSLVQIAEILLGVCVVVGPLIFLVFFIDSHTHESLSQPRDLDDFKFVSLVVAWWSAIHNKICPILKVETEEPDDDR